jgi:hypothetical protein
MTRTRTIVAAIAAMALAVPGVASAATSKVTGGTTQISVSAAAAKVLSDNHITATPLAPATASGTTFTFPITGGFLNTNTLRGVIRHAGGLSLSNGTRTVNVHRPTIVSDRSGVSLWALVRGRTIKVCHPSAARHLRLRCISVTRFATVRVARITHVSLSNGTATGTVKITAATAGLVNQLAAKHVVSAGATLGTATVKPTLK